MPGRGEEEQFAHAYVPVPSAARTRDAGRGGGGARYFCVPVYQDTIRILIFNINDSHVLVCMCM